MVIVDTIDGINMTSAQIELYYRQKQYTRPGIDPLCGWTWLDLHLHDLDNWTPTIEIDRPGSHFKFSIKDKQILKEVSKIIREK
jgi:hypothetical protein